MQISVFLSIMFPLFVHYTANKTVEIQLCKEVLKLSDKNEHGLAVKLLLSFKGDCKGGCKVPVYIS